MTATTEQLSEAALVVVGGGPAGHAAAQAYREAGGAGRVVLISADDAQPYQRPPLSKDYLRGESDESALPLEAPEFYPDGEIELWLADPVTALDLTSRTISTQSGRQLSFTSCVLATGCRPTELDVPGGDHPGVRRLRSLTEARLLRGAAVRAKTAVVIGSGFIGCEAAVSLASRGLTVTMVTPSELPQLERLGRAAAERLKSWLDDAGVIVRTGQEVTEIHDGTTVLTADGRSAAADLILTAVGVTPNSTLAAEAGLALEKDRILVDERMATATTGVYACGDVALANNALAGRRLLVEHWGEALRMGEIAGANAAGGDQQWSEVPGFWSSIGDRTLKYAAWGDGFDDAQLVEHGGGSFTIWYATAGRAVGVLTHRFDDDYERGRQLIEDGASIPVH